MAELLLRLEELCLYDGRNVFTKMMGEKKYGREVDRMVRYAKAWLRAELSESEK